MADRKQAKRGLWAYILLFMPIPFSVLAYLVTDYLVWLLVILASLVLLVYLFVSKKGRTVSNVQYLLLLLLFWVPALIPIAFIIFFIDLASGL